MIDARLTFIPADIALNSAMGGRGSGGGGEQVPLLGIRRAEFSPPKVRARYSRGISKVPAHSPRLADLAWSSLGTYLRE